MLTPAVNIVVVLGAERMYSDLAKQLSTQKTSIGEQIHVLHLNKSEGVVERDDNFMLYDQESAVKEYFFGTASQTLSPFTNQVDFDSLVIYKTGECASFLHFKPVATLY